MFIRTSDGTHFLPGIGRLVAAVKTDRVAALVQGERTALVLVRTSEQQVKAGFNHRVPPSWHNRSTD